jgi:predicted Rossmann fold flavoprotein
VRRVRRGDEYSVETTAGEFRAPALVVATGGLSIPKIGATGFGYDLARQFGLKIVEPRPALVPLLFGAGDRARYGELAGVSARVAASAGARSFRGAMLFTHRGLSGPAILQISTYWNLHEAIVIDLAPGATILRALRESTGSRSLSEARRLFREALPARFADRWLALHAPERWNNAAIDALERAAHRWEIEPAGDEGFAKAEVTAGGVDTSELSAKTMECHRVPGLYFIGEVVDVTGQLGGFNFQWAWASGFCAGNAL